jgi:hypothetical protein
MKIPKRPFHHYEMQNTFDCLMRRRR